MVSKSKAQIKHTMIAMCSCLHIYVMDPNLVPNNIELEGVIMAKSEKSFFFFSATTLASMAKAARKERKLCAWAVSNTDVRQKTMATALAKTTTKWGWRPKFGKTTRIKTPIATATTTTKTMTSTTKIDKDYRDHNDEENYHKNNNNNDNNNEKWQK